MTGETNFIEYNEAIDGSFEAKNLLDSEITCDSDNESGPHVLLLIKSYLKYYPL